MSAHSSTTAFIAGGTQGLGLAIAEQLVAEGARRIAVTGRDRARTDAAGRRLEELGADAVALTADLSDVGATREAFAEASSRLGLVNALAVAGASTARGSLTGTDEATYDAVMAANVRGPFFLMQAFARALQERKAPGSAVTILSVSMYCGQSFLAPYSASKAALATLTRNAASAHRTDRIRFNGVAPGWMNTPGEDAIQRSAHNARDGWLDAAAAKQPFGQLVEPADVARLVSYLLSPASGVMTGAVIDVDQTVVMGTGE